MTQQVRKNVFETNSSSSHSLTLAQGDLVAQPFSSDILRSGTLVVAKGEFGWEWHRYYSAEKKIQYLFTQLFRENIPKGEAAGVTAELRQSNRRFDMLCRVVMEHTGVDIQVTPGSEGYIDHDSEGVGIELFQTDEGLKQFLFSPASYIETGNDNTPSERIIFTDRGDEHFYCARYREPKADDVEVPLQSASKWGYDSFYTAGGALLDDASNSQGLYAALKATATVMKLVVDCQSPTEPYRYSDPQSNTMSELDDAGISFSANLAVSVQYKRVSRNEPEKHYERNTFYFRMPADLAEKLAALPATPKEVVAEVDD